MKSEQEIRAEILALEASIEQDRQVWKERQNGSGSQELTALEQTINRKHTMIQAWHWVLDEGEIPSSVNVNETGSLSVTNQLAPDADEPAT